MRDASQVGCRPDRRTRSPTWAPPGLTSPSRPVAASRASTKMKSSGPLCSKDCSGAPPSRGASSTRLTGGWGWGALRTRRMSSGRARGAQVRVHCCCDHEWCLRAGGRCVGPCLLGCARCVRAVMASVHCTKYCKGVEEASHAHCLGQGLERASTTCSVGLGLVHAITVHFNTLNA